MKTALVCFSLLLLPPLCSAQDWPPASWTTPVEPFRIDGPVYYVGGQELAAYLIDGQRCLILVNVGMAENASMVLNSIEALGFDPTTIDYLLITQAHFDHGGGAAQIQRATGAHVMAGDADALLLQRGGHNDYVFGDALTFDPVQRAEAVEDLQRLDCGTLNLISLSTPGHTPGSTSWLLTVDGEADSQSFLFQSSISVLGDAVVIDNPRYPTIVSDYWQTLDRLSSIKVSHVLPDHIQNTRPSSATEADVPEASWFVEDGQIGRQLQYSRDALKAKLEYR